MDGASIFVGVVAGVLFASLAWAMFAGRLLGELDDQITTLEDAQRAHMHDGCSLCDEIRRAYWEAL